MKKIYFILILVSVFFSCKRDTNSLDSLGPKYITVESALSISSDPADFTIGNVNFNAKLTVASLWKIEVRGTKSGAVKRFSATSQFIDASNTNWDGSSDTTVSFKIEPCTATLYIPATKITRTITFNAVFDRTPFTITQHLAINADPVNFGVLVYFTGEFNKSKNWSITITGITSGAKKKITGNSNVLASSNTNWDGSSDSAYFFRAELCQAVIGFPDTSLTQTINFTIATPKTHPGYLIDDFEASGFGSYMGSNNGNFFDAPDQASSTIDLYTFSPAPEGSKVLRLDCVDVNGNYYSGGVYHNSIASTYGFSSISSDSLYLNLFVYGYSVGNAALSIELGEADGDKWLAPQININWTGWKLVSLQFSQMTNHAGTGNIIRESNMISSVNMSMNSVPTPGLSCKALVDYLIFTQGKVLMP